MSFTKEWSIFLFVLISVMVKESQTCFTANVTHEPLTLKSQSSFYEECICEDPLYSSQNIYWVGPDGHEIGPGTGAKVYTERGPQLIKLIIPSLTRAMAGTYMCLSNGTNGIQYAISYEIDVYEGLYILPANISPQFLIKGQDSLIRCTAKGHKAPMIWWYKGANQIQLYNDDKYQIGEEGILIKNASKEDEDEYHCTAEVPYTGEVKDAFIKVELMIPPKVESLNATLDNVVIEGDSLTLDCLASGFPIPTYSWRKFSKQNDTPEMIGTPEEDFHKLVFKSVKMHDEGTYECIAKNKAGISRMNITISVLAPPKIKEFKNVSIVENTRAEIICEAIGRPQPVININFYGAPTEHLPYEKNISNNPDELKFGLIFESVKRSHEGDYWCNASNKIGYDEKYMYLKVFYKPFFENVEETVWAWAGNAVNLSCDYQSQPSSTVQWSFQGDSSVDFNFRFGEHLTFWSEQLKTITENYLTVTPNEKYYYGTYICTAINVYGAAKKIIHLREGFKPSKLETDQVNITNIAATSVTFDIEDREMNGPPLTGYTAEYDELKNYDVTLIHNNRTWAVNITYKIDKLDPLKTYKVRFAAINQVGTGPHGEYITFTTPDKSAPEPPEVDGLEPLLIPAHNKILKLKSPEHNGDPIDYYSIKYCPVNSDECIEQTVSPTTELNLDHLSYNTSYRIEMSAHNSMGNSTPVSFYITVEASKDPPSTVLPAETIVGISVVVVILAILVLDVILFFTLMKGMIATCVHKREKKKDAGKISRDKKGLLKDNKEVPETVKRPDNGHKEFEYNKTTGVIIGKHSAV